MRRVLNRVISTGAVALTVMTVVAACGQPPKQHSGGNTAGAPRPERLRVEVVDVLPHDPEAFTQGLELVDDTLYEGTGLVGESTLRAGPLGGEPTTVVSLPAPLFGEGITVVDDRVWQLTWRDGIAIERDRTTLAELRRVHYEGEGWGLCHQDERDRLVMSDGTATLTFRDPDDFSVLGAVQVTDTGDPVVNLNELECVGDDVYANVWHTDDILRIDPDTGFVTARIDASDLLTPEEAADADVLNGIAALDGSDHFLVTGKLWPKMFTVRFVPTD
ncbi:Glutamine cyclotransferase [Saccharomonospora viridis]|uniref:Glutaminyl-peptide cyclotransferase n=1 Tax=Saccharomonospora viridis TaxID=1852 RepID=A0A837D8H9_9PSEU|nr:glutaminyl-peptide cyclotransferase [Saccharomonospora viridis]SFP58073.1 Glutamine cyclotransferase [Saccharomonospora viridis]